MIILIDSTIFIDQHRYKSNINDRSLKILQFFLIPQPNNSYIVSLYGKNGEGLNNKNIDIESRPNIYKPYITFSLTTDKNGRIYLPENLCNDYYYLSVYCKTLNVRNSWDINKNK